MKKLLLIAKLMLVIGALPLSAQIIPNYNFENWSNGANAAPDNWQDHGTNHPGFYPVTRSTDYSLGTYSVRLENKIANGDTTKGEFETFYPGYGEGLGPVFPVSTAYTSLKGFYKYVPENGDSAMVMVALFKDGYANTQGFANLLAFGYAMLGTASTFTPFSSIDFWYDGAGVPDSAYINIAAFKGIDITNGQQLPVHGNSVLYVDALNFDSYISGINDPNAITRNFNLYPTVGSGEFNLWFDTDKSDFTTIRVYDMQGREVKDLFAGTLSQGAHTFHYAINDLENSAYLLVVATGSGYRTEKIVISK